MTKSSKILILAALGLAAGWLVLRAERRRARESESPSPAAAPRDASAGVGEIELDAAPSSGRVSVAQDSVPVAEAPAPRDDSAAPPARLWRARVVDGDSQAPLAEASLAVVEDDPFAGIDDGAWKPVRPDGTIELALATERGTLAVVCPGYASAYVVPRSDEADPDRLQVVELRRAATLQVRVRDERSVRSEPATVELLVEDSDLFTNIGFRSRGEVFAWPEQLGADGALLFEALPPHREFSLDARAGETRLHHQLLFLSPGQREELEISLHDGCAIAGRALTPEGEPVAGLEVWLVSEPRLPGRYFNAFADIQARTTTDARGEFAFEDVAPRVWFVGPAAERAWPVARLASRRWPSA